MVGTNPRRADRLFAKAKLTEPNFMTPEIMWRRMIGPYAVELSKGRGFVNDDLFGVTVVDASNPEKGALHELSRCFGHLSTALVYVRDLRQ